LPGTPLAGHLWTIGPTLRARLAGAGFAPAEPWQLEIDEPAVGRIALTGRLRRGGERGALFLHGLGGSAESAYLAPVEQALASRGWTTLRLNLRGSDGTGSDLFHAGLVDDLPRVAAAPELAGLRELAVVGFSLGGHVALRFAATGAAPRVTRVAAICPPLDLDLGARALDARAAALYRWHLLRGLNAVYAAVAARRPLPVPIDRVRRARSIREWDGLVVVPRFGFASAEDYYAKASVAPLLPAIALPAWIVLGESDPMVPPETVRDALRGVSPSTEVTWTPRGGHVGFPADLDLGRGAEPGLPAQLAAWLEGATR
jgi:predicted alpha/beta-fold hydrolase